MEGTYKKYDEIPEFTRKFIDKNSIPDGKVPISKWTTFWKLPLPQNIIKSLFKDFNKNCEYIQQDSDIITLLSNLFVDNKQDSFRRGLNAWGQSMFQKDPVLLDVKAIKCNE